MPEREFHLTGSHADCHAPSDLLYGGLADAEEDIQSIVGVSISRTQTRLRSPVTPAAEAATAFVQDGSIGSWHRSNEAPQPGVEYDAPSLQANEASPTGDSELSASSGETPLPSPWTSSPKAFEEHRIEPERQISQDAQSTPTTGTFGTFVDLNVKRFVSAFAMPSLPKPPSIRDIPIPALFALLSNKESPQVDDALRRQKRANSLIPQKPQWLSPSIGAISEQGWKGDSDKTITTSRAKSADSVVDANSLRFVASRSSKEAVQDLGLPPPMLKRSTSDQSLAIRRESSLGSSLGDDARWENVQKMVNSRAKAIADSLQDSSIKLPSLPTVKLDSLRPDFLKGRATSNTDRMPQLNRPSGSTQAASHGSTSYHSSKTQSGRRHQSRSVNGLRAPKTALKTENSYFTQALESLTGDVIILGGYRGSILRSAKPPYRQLWVPVKVGLNIRKVNLEVGLGLEDEDRMEETIFPSGMLSHIGPVDMGRRLLKRLRSCRNAQEGRLRVHDYGYDWRLSPHLLSRRLIQYLESLISNTKTSKGVETGATVIAHSLGGLITRHAVNQRPELFAGVVYAGVPQHCINILGPMRNGDEVLLSSKVLTAQVNFTFRTSYLLLPDDEKCFIDKRTNEDYPVNFFDIAEWKRHALSPCIAPALSPFAAPERKGLLNSMADNLMALPLFGRKGLPLKSGTKNERDIAGNVTMADREPRREVSVSSSSPLTEPQSTIPIAEAEEYLGRTLATTVCFKDELKFKLSHAQENLYPPLSVLYGTSVPTVYRARVASRAAIRCRDAYDDLAFASGDGVCLARAAMLPAGYSCTTGGKVKTGRGHVGLLGDLEGIGKCLVSVIEGRKQGIGLGNQAREGHTKDERALESTKQ
ncbi:MAG: hypothetical protein LQ337_006269 [Flavoplaca oasis]|nr:MAG: hypothetical protein LQ337_006269 [Flavoplaca oasis]